MKEYIDIRDKNGKKKKAEVCFRYHDEEYDWFYIVYKYDDEYFVAKYDDFIGMSRLDTNLTDEEMEMLEEVLNELKGV